MSSNRFTAEEKQHALQMMEAKEMTQAQIAKEIGCSVAALVLWRKEAQEAQGDLLSCEECAGDAAAKERAAGLKQAQAVWKQAEEVAEVSVPQPGSIPFGRKAVQAANKKIDALHALKRAYWSRHIDTLIAPAEVSGDEYVADINKALEFAYDNLVK